MYIKQIDHWGVWLRKPWPQKSHIFLRRRMMIN